MHIRYVLDPYFLTSCFLSFSLPLFLSYLSREKNWSPQGHQELELKTRMYSQGIVKEPYSQGLTVLPASKEPQTQTLQRLESGSTWDEQAKCRATGSGGDWGKVGNEVLPGEGGYHSTPTDTAVSDSKAGVARSLDFSWGTLNPDFKKKFILSVLGLYCGTWTQLSCVGS